MMNLTGVSGAIILLFPQLYRKFATNLLYEHPNWFTAGVRLIGAIYVLLAVGAFRKRRVYN